MFRKGGKKTKILTPNNFDSLEEIENTIFDFQKEYEKVAKPFEWKFTREDLKKLLHKFDEKQKMAA
jgi:archaellum component FlaC